MSTKRLVVAALMLAVVTTLTLIVIPLPVSNGYINLGDAGVYAAVSLLGPLGIAVAGIGSALADLVLGYAIYAPATLVIKACTAALCLLLLRGFRGHARVVAMLISGIAVVGGYFLFEAAIVTGSAQAALVNVPFNAVQAAIGAVMGYIITNIAEKVYKK